MSLPAAAVRAGALGPLVKVLFVPDEGEHFGELILGQSDVHLDPRRHVVPVRTATRRTADRKEPAGELHARGSAAMSRQSNW